MIGIAVVALVAALVIGLRHFFGSGPNDSIFHATERADSGSGSRVLESPRPRDGSQRPQGQAPVLGTPAAVADARAMVREQGDYRPPRESLLKMSMAERFDFMLGELVRLRSRLGNGHDYAEKLAIINEFGGARAMDLKNRLLKATGKDLDPVGDKDFITSLDHESWRTMVSGAAEQNSSKAFELAMADLGDAHQRIACAEVTSVWLGLDSVAASKRVAELPKGALKDAAIGAMVSWLVGRGSATEASPWIAEITDNELREKMVAFAGH